MQQASDDELRGSIFPRIRLMLPTCATKQLSLYKRDRASPELELTCDHPGSVDRVRSLSDRMRVPFMLARRPIVPSQSFGTIASREACATAAARLGLRRDVLHSNHRNRNPRRC